MTTRHWSVFRLTTATLRSENGRKPTAVAELRTRHKYTVYPIVFRNRLRIFGVLHLKIVQYRFYDDYRILSILIMCVGKKCFSPGWYDTQCVLVYLIFTTVVRYGGCPERDGPHETRQILQKKFFFFFIYWLVIAVFPYAVVCHILYLSVYLPSVHVYVFCIFLVCMVCINN